MTSIPSAWRDHRQVQYASATASDGTDTSNTVNSQSKWWNRYAPSFLRSEPSWGKDPESGTVSDSSNWSLISDNMGGMTWTQRWTCFGITFAFGVLLLFLAFLHLPFAILNPRKFVLPWTLGVILLISCLGFVLGWKTFWKQLWTPSRRPITIFNLITLCATLVSCLYFHMYVLIVLSSILQVIGLLGWVISAFPGGSGMVSAAGGMVGDYVYRSVLPGYALSVSVSRNILSSSKLQRHSYQMFKISEYSGWISIRKENLRHLKKYEYHGSDISLLRRYILGYYWNWLSTIVPKWIHPNLISLTGFLSILSQAILCIYLSPWGFEPLPSWTYFSIAIGLFVYQSMDSVDGAHARNIGIDGPLGELIDHGLDALASMLYSILLGYIFCMDIISVWIIYTGFFGGFYFVFLEVYMTKSLILEIVNVPSEGLILMILFSVISGCFGPDIWHKDLFYSITAFKILASFVILGLFYPIIRCYHTIMKSFGKYKKNNRTLGRIILNYWINITIFQLCGGFWLYYRQTYTIPLLLDDSNIHENSILRYLSLFPCSFLIMYGAACTYILTESIVSRLVKQPLAVHHLYQYSMILGGILSILESHEWIWKGSSESYLMILLITFLVKYLVFLLGTLYTICNYLNISCFSLKESHNMRDYKPKDVDPYHKLLN